VDVGTLGAKGTAVHKIDLGALAYEIP
jgi:hypothetical protein